MIVCCIEPNVLPTVISIVSIIISVINFGFMIYSFFKYDNKIKAQQTDINDFTKSENKEKLDMKMQAYVICEQIDNQHIRIINKGRAPAFNVRFNYDDNELEFRTKDGLFPYPKIIPGQYIALYFISEYATHIHQSITITWDDGFGKNRKTEEIINLNY